MKERSHRKANNKGNDEPQIEPRLFTAKQLSVYLGFPVSTIYAMVERKEIPFKRFGKKAIRFDRAAIDRWIDEHYDKSYEMS